MAFPASPNNGDTHVEGGRTYEFDDSIPGWRLVSAIENAVPEAPIDDLSYVRRNGLWMKSGRVFNLWSGMNYSGEFIVPDDLWVNLENPENTVNRSLLLLFSGMARSTDGPATANFGGGFESIGFISSLRLPSPDRLLNISSDPSTYTYNTYFKDWYFYGFPGRNVSMREMYLYHYENDSNQMVVNFGSHRNPSGPMAGDVYFSNVVGIGT